ncbi:hypothetical protein ONS95_008308 [Cadophora gregata]|uniref:uncharacterized protein n=1 Tax=Cadophora gregata TaxID=51156 RepID=UPI0026DAFF70|nr:uncharacterized protein ONS95_008308 [Cadophora gregata]KAK0100355.1 hypothetical protein ONS96_007635 [Cadophora gregata f. sp. sojae]KAK0126728.1 hypothetical protein ONS95_008308 [Cadophora gregata]
MNQLEGPESKGTGSTKKGELVVDTKSSGLGAHQQSIHPHVNTKTNKQEGFATRSADLNDVDLPTPAKKVKVGKSEIKARNGTSVSPYLAEIEILKGQHIAEIKKLKEEYKTEIESLKSEDQDLRQVKAVNKLEEEHQAEIEKLKQQNEELKHTVEAQKSRIRVQEHLVQVGAAVRGRWFELAKRNAGVGEPIAVIVEAGERAITRGNIRADLAMLQLGYASLPSVQAAQSAVGNLDADSKYKEGYFKDLYTLSFSDFAQHLLKNFCSYPLKKLEICEMSGTMTSLTGYSVTSEYEYMNLLHSFQALAIRADEEWVNHICHLWPDHQRRLNTANNWPPLEMIVRDMRSIVEEIAQGAPNSPPPAFKSPLAAKTNADSPFNASTRSAAPKPTGSMTAKPALSGSASWNTFAPSQTTPDTPSQTTPDKPDNALLNSD